MAEIQDLEVLTMNIGGIDIVLPGEKPEVGESKVKAAVPGGHYDLAIIGGGPAGMTAAVYAARKFLNMILITGDLGGQVLWTSDVENYMGYSYVTGPELMERFSEQVKQFGLTLALGETTTRLARNEKAFRIFTKEGSEYTASSVIVASGKSYRKLNVPGEKELTGHGVSYCATCDAPLFSGKEVAVIGGGNSAFQAAVDLLPVATKISVVNIADSWQADPILVDRVERSKKFAPYLNHEVVSISGEDRVSGIVVKDRGSGEGKELPIGGVFVEIGLIPNSGFVKDFLLLNDGGEIVVDCACRTNVAGVFAAGDVTNVPEKQIVVAAGEGAKAALGAYHYLIKKEKVKEVEDGYH